VVQHQHARIDGTSLKIRVEIFLQKESPSTVSLGLSFCAMVMESLGPIADTHITGASTSTFASRAYLCTDMRQKQIDYSKFGIAVDRSLILEWLFP
jgi:hypothetical protein